MEVSIKQLRANMKQYMDLVTRGEELVIRKNSIIIGTLMPAFPKPKPKVKQPSRPPIRLKNGQFVTIRQFEAADQEPVILLHEIALRAVGAYDEFAATNGADWDLNDIEGSYFDSGGDFLVAEKDGVLVGMGAICLYGPKNTAQIKRMRVRPDLQGQGLGPHLLKLLEERARQLGYTTMVLDTVVDTPAQAFYERYGYRETRRETHKDQELVFYQKEL